MKDLFLRVATATPDVVVADCKSNEEAIQKAMQEAADHGASIVVFPELSLTGYTCNDLFLQNVLLREAKASLLRLAQYTEACPVIAFVGLPYLYQNCLYDAVAVLGNGQVLGLIPKTYIPNYSEFYERRYFTPAPEDTVLVDDLGDEPVAFGTKQLFVCDELPSCRIAVEICEDLWVPNPPSIAHALNGATIVVNASASPETTGKDSYRRALVQSQSASLVCAYLYANAGEGESTQDLVFGGQSLIAENGTLLAESKRFENGITYADLDLGRIESERRRMTTYDNRLDDYSITGFSIPEQELDLHRFVDSMPFVPSDKNNRDSRCEEILMMQAMGLKKRLAHTHAQTAVIGLSGGLDSTLALLVTVKAFDLLGMDHKQIIAVTMPCFGTTNRTYKNAVGLAMCLNTTLKEIRIADAVKQHFFDIGHDPAVTDVTYENSQARERTQILMDLANAENGLVIGTGDLSELALGWATYNGDHMSMYAVNCSVPKTLVRHLVRYYADTCRDFSLTAVLSDILDTPVSPELLPPVDGVISQNTEELVGPYELHDFFLYYVMRFGYTPGKIYRLACHAFADRYEKDVILGWLKVFYRRFFAQQFKRSCLPDGPKVGSVAISPRGDLRMPSDASVRLWQNELDEL